MRARKLAALALLASLIAAAQAGANASAKQRFEAVKIRRFAPEPGGTDFPIGVSGGPGSANPGRIVYTNCTLQYLVTLAYGVKEFQVNSPAWMYSIPARFTIDATIRPGATQAQVHRMLQNLLAGRFKLAVHRETEEMAVRELMVAKNGPKLKPAAGNLKSPPEMIAELIAKNGTRRITATGQTMQALADQLNSPSFEPLLNRAGGPVLNETALSGKYDFVLEYTATTGELETMKRAGFPDAAGKAAQFPDLSSALEQQLGLRLEPRKGSIEILVVDHCEKQPTKD